MAEEESEDGVVQPVAEAETLQEARPARRISDQPHHFSIVFSVVAIAVSLFSWWESHNARLVSQGSNRGILYVSDVKMAESDEDASKSDFLLQIRNVGRSTVAAEQYWAAFETNPENNTPGFRHTPHFFGVPPAPRGSPLRKVNTDVPPGAEFRLRLTLDFDARGYQATRNTPLSVYVFGELFYRDEATGRSFKTPWCFNITSGQASSSCESVPENSKTHE